jgi:hypothetical protein
MRGYPFEPKYGLLPFSPRVQSILFLDCPHLQARKIMSRILEALKHAQTGRDSKALAEPPVADVVEIPNRRRSRRLALDVAVYVYGHGPGKEPFHEEAHTLKVNANGALLLLSVPVQKGQRLLLTNQLTEREQDCRVVFLGTRHSRTVETGVAFPQTNPTFWQMHPLTEDDPAA